MNLLSRLFGTTQPNCENCHARPAAKSIPLPTGETVRLCERCDSVIGEMFRHPLHDFQFERILEAVPVDARCVLNIAWGSNRDQVLAAVPQVMANAIKRTTNLSPTLLTAPVTVDDHDVDFHFSFGHAGLDVLTFGPKKPVLDARGPLLRRFGEPWRERQMPSLGKHAERQTIWLCDGFEVVVEQTAYYTVMVTYQLPRYSLANV